MGAESLMIGWDVGGWNCDRNRLSRDALVVVDQDLQIRGKPWRGNLREQINQAETTDDFVRSLLHACQHEDYRRNATVVLGIDTPLGFSAELVSLLVSGRSVPVVNASSTNPYLFRFTERYLFERGLSPLSAIKDMIGSQATKGMHVLGRFLPNRLHCGIWTNEGQVSAIEVYPSSAKRSDVVKQLKQRCFGYSAVISDEWHEDEQDALTAALIAWLFRFEPDRLVWPPAEAPEQEGWIFVPQDSLVTLPGSKGHTCPIVGSRG
ncbi:MULTISPECIES: hypothetical protein [Pseudomonas]|uniref:DUF429 domain-containing protein n=1 Tax=Pseudomonas putida TaxID=303 RepID=A0AAW6PPC9_PSEPU|nr:MULTISPECIES: hypothetical protein [Pseudomonas]MDF3871410.1 hypothetical protein [Pseudomonas putida]MDF3875061.1 hypothetical protein [Pseudomonas putida]WPU60457.1 hypothetical protein SQW15_00280 [Pseudomonas asiatica]